MSHVRRTVCSLLVLLGFLPALNPATAATTTPVAFDLTIYGNANTPTIRLDNRSRFAIASFELTIGDFDKSFDYVSSVAGNYGGSYSVSSPDQKDGERRSDTIKVTFPNGLPRGGNFRFETDIDTDSNSGQDYRRVLFNNGQDRPNATLKVTLADGSSSTAMITLPDGAADSGSYVFQSEARERILVVSSSTETDSDTRVGKVTVRIDGSDVTGFVEGTSISVYDGERIEVTAAREVYRDLFGNDITDSAENRPELIQEQAQERFTALGMSLNNVAPSGDPTYINFDVDGDARVVVKWQHEFALVVEHDFGPTESTEKDEAGNPWAGPLESEAEGNPQPPTKKNWVKKGETVIAQVDGQVLDFNRPGLDVRYVPIAYEAWGPPNGSTLPLQDRTQIEAGSEPTRERFGWQPRQSPPLRQQVPQFTMYGPGFIKYVWRIQFGVRVNVDDPTRAGLTKVYSRDSGGSWVEVGNGEGTFWFDPNASVRVLAAANEKADGNGLALRGWYNGDGHYFSTQGEISSENGSLLSGGPVVLPTGASVASWLPNPADLGLSRAFRGLEIPQLRRASRVFWRYDRQAMTVVARIGEFVFQDQPALADQFSTRPELIEQRQVTGLNRNVPADQMTIWDPVASRLYPLVPGRFAAKWRPDPSRPETMDVTVDVRYPDRPHYPHIANTPPVALDPDPADTFVFREIKYTETDGAVDSERRFTATAPGHTVFLFSELQKDGRGVTREFMRVRVVETKDWESGLVQGDAIIGQKVPSLGFDRANLGTGFVFDLQGKARYNPFIYDSEKLNGLAARDVYDMAALRSDAASKIVIHKEKLPGQIIPVNLFPGAARDEKLIVVWYDDPAENDLLLWPHRAVVYSPRWPTTPDEGLGKIVIASQFGSESLDDLGNDQEVVEGIDGGPAETTYNPSRLQQVQVYSQPDNTLPGYNPNEEHGLTAPSLRFADVSPRPPAIYALRSNDLNEFNPSLLEEDQDPDTYTSHPRVLVQFFDTEIQEYRMRVYEVAAENDRYKFALQGLITPANAGGTVDTDVSRLNGQPHVDMEAGEPVIPFYPLGVAIGASPCASTSGANIKSQLTYWEDHRGTSWSVSGGSNAWFTVRFFYPLAPDFWWPENRPGYLRQDKVGNDTVRRATVPAVGDCVAFQPTNIRDLTGTAPEAIVADSSSAFSNSGPIRILYKSEWPRNVPILKAGETLTFAGGEYRADNPFTTVNGELVETEGLPGVTAFASAEVVFDSQNPAGNLDGWRTNWTARVAQVLDVRSVPLSLGDFPTELQPATKRSRVKGGKYVFDELPSSLQRRFRYDPLSGRLELNGLLNDKEIGDRTLTAAPPAVYILEPNILTEEERDALKSLDNFAGGSKWDAAIDDLFKLSRNPSLVDTDSSLFVAEPSGSSGRATWQTGLEQFWRHYYFGVLPADATAAAKLSLYPTVSGLSARDPVPTPIPLSTTNASVSTADNGYLVGLEPKRVFDTEGNPVVVTEMDGPGSPEDPPQNFPRPVFDPRQAVPMRAFGPGLAVLPNGDFLQPSSQPRSPSYVAVVENNDPSLGGSPITVHIIKVDPEERYRGAIKTVASDNVFDENVVLRHTGDFGANANDLVFEWWYRFDDGSLNVPPPDRVPAGTPNPWKLFPDPTGKAGRGRFQMTLAGNPNVPEALLADSFWFVRYRHADDVVEGTNWKKRQLDGSPSVRFEWAGAGNSVPPDDYRAQLAQGWIKRVLDAVNPYEARIRDFEGQSPSTVVNLISQLGQPYVGPVALNPDKNVIENVGLIELYETILKRGRDLSIDLSRPVSTPAIANALQLASTRISDFYTILGNEAYTDALDPTIGFGSDGEGVEDAVEAGSFSTSVFAFQNQQPSLLEEELALLRGVDDFFARPVYNRLFWNFTKAEGEAAYAINYNITDVNRDGFINEADAMMLYPQGHGDAWGHYLTALRNQYDLLREPNFNWVSRSEFYNLQDIVLKVDFLDERKFAQMAAARAKAGAEIVNLTYRSAYVEDPNAQWQGYSDVDPDRAWGVQEWARRAGQAAYFDWVTANALLPSVHPNETLEGVQKVDRQSNSDIAVISANLNAIQSTFDQANKGHNPLGLPGNAVPFDLSGAMIDDLVFGQTHFEQIAERAEKAMANAVAVWENANQPRNMLRQVGNSEAEQRNAVFQEDLTYRNELIRIFGKPYEGTIGPGKVYPAGYDGPDLLLYMYVNVRELNDDTVPGPTTSFASFNGNTLIGPSDIYDAVVDGLGNGDAPRGTLSQIGSPGTVTLQGYLTEPVLRLFAPTFYPDASAGKVSVRARDGLYAVNYTDLTSPKVPLQGLTQIMPVTAAGYTFQAPREWGAREASGELQLLINQMIQQEAQIASAIGAWDGLQGGIVREIRFINAKLDMSANIRLKNEIFSRIKSITLGILTAAEGVKEALEAAKDTVSNTFEGTEKLIPIGLPTAGLAVSPGDALGPTRGGIALASIGVTAGMDGVLVGIKIAKAIAESGLSITENELDLFEKREQDALDAKEMLKNLENMVGDEPIRRIEIFKEIEALRGLSDQYRALVDQGTRLIDERTAYNKRVAAATQRNRYQDMTFRVARNHSMQNYRSTFNVAARYAYMLAKAYDYETNLDPGHPAHPGDAIRDIIRARSLGLHDGESRMGAGGLAESIAWLKANYLLQKPQLGINNPIYESADLSLRTELYRILPADPEDPSAEDPDELWARTLESARVADLWEIPEFRNYCRPFAPSTDSNGERVREPGLVIRFGSQILAGKNFFGRPLAGGDYAFDPSVFATKISGAGVGLVGYEVGDPLGGLPQSPRCYLIPVGADVMSVPHSPDPEVVRVWNVFDARIPVPYPAQTAQLDSSNWIPLLDSLNGQLGESRKFSSFLASYFSADDEEGATTIQDRRLVGRSIWNTQWILIIPGRQLNADPDAGLDLLIEQVKDIRLGLQTYGYSGN